MFALLSAVPSGGNERKAVKDEGLDPCVLRE
jgi:hypothetical protein